MVVQSAEDRQGYNSSGRMDGSGDRSVLDKGQMRSSDVVVFRIRAEHMAQMSLPEDEDVIKHSRRIEPISRSTWPFCQGDRGAVGLSRMPMARMRRVNASP
jgi:hypothetical protein